MIYTKIKTDPLPADTYSDVEIENGIYYGIFWDNKSQKPYKKPLGKAVYVCKKLINLDDFSQYFILKFEDCNGGEYEEVIFPRKKVNKKDILELSAYGVMVEENSAKYLMHAILKQELSPKLSVEYVHTNLGFKLIDRELVFLGDKGYGLNSMYNGEISIKPQGNFKKWLKMIQCEVLGNTGLETILAISAAGVLKDFLKNLIDCTNPFVHLIGESSTGKSTAGLLAVSLGSSPNIADKSFVFTCASTQNSIMHSLSNAYPVLLDEGSQLSGDKTSFLYAVSNGKDKGRLTQEMQLRDSNVFNTAVFLTSEKSILDECDKNNGLRVRILEFVNTTWTNSAESADNIKSVIRNHYGFGVPKIAELLMNCDINEIVKWYNEQVKEVYKEMQKHGDLNDFSKRLAKNFALIICASEICNEALNLDLNSEAILHFLLSNNLLKNAETADLGLRAYEFILAYVETHAQLFPVVMKNRNAEAAYSEDYANHVIEGMKKDEYLYIVESAFEKIIKSSGFSEPKVIMKKLKDKGILIPESSDRYTCRFCLPSSKIRVTGYRIKITF